MKTSAKDLLTQIPDFDDFVALSREISDLMFARLKLDAEIKARESEVFRIASTDEKYMVNGKPLTSTYIENAYKFGGLDGELLPLRQRLAELTSELEQRRLKLDIWKTMIEVWRTVSASERSSAV